MGQRSNETEKEFIVVGDFCDILEGFFSFVLFLFS